MTSRADTPIERAMGVFFDPCQYTLDSADLYVGMSDE